ncbi:MAG: hypothetical protein LBK99_18965 [Opitutaceae bacterium]|jgi:hypothetical protein|nr:hypothetical protein [Opitutaceae bacterium]
MFRIRKTILAFVFTAVAMFAANTGAAQNLLQNGMFNSGKDRSVTRWIFPPGSLKAHGADAEKITWGSEVLAEGGAEGGNRVAFIATITPVKARIWWQQEVVAEGGATYVLSVRIAGDVPTKTAANGKPGYASTDIGIYFLDANNKWIGYQRLPPDSFPSDWKTVTFKTTAPDNTAKIGVRLGISANVEIKAHFDDAVLVTIDE